MHFTLILTTFVYLATAQTVQDPTVQLDSATITGISSERVNLFLGITYAQPPVEDLRFRLPAPLLPYTSDFGAKEYGRSCPSSGEGTGRNCLPLGATPTADETPSPEEDLDPNSEDCLTVNVITPKNITPQSKLPVFVWIYGGGFARGSSFSNDGSVIVKRSMDLNQPLVYVSMNYRVNAFGFIGGKEVKDADATNIGLQDQREALRWVQKYIAAFGGDPTKVTLSGGSAGAISVSLHMIANDGNVESLFHGAFMVSGAPLPVSNTTSGQQAYDFLAAGTGCNNVTDTLNCMRGVSYQELKKVVDSATGGQIVTSPWLPRADGTFLTDNPQRLVQRGVIANIPYVSGNCDDEGTKFALTSVQVSTDAQLRGMLKKVMPQMTDSQMSSLMALYPDDVTEGSPYNTSVLNAITPQYKRMASMEGDVVFQAPRRHFMQYSADKQPTWSFLSKRLKSTMILGSYHGSAVQTLFGPGDLTDYAINFVNTLNPNGGNMTEWPQYTMDSKQMLAFYDGSVPRGIERDAYRAEQMTFLTEMSLANPV